MEPFNLRPFFLMRLPTLDDASYVEVDAVRNACHNSPVARFGHDRHWVPNDCLVIGRYSVLPYYEELEQMIESYGSRLINTYQEHRYIEKMDWAMGALRGLTPPIVALDDLSKDGKYVLKGTTNSRKDKWSTDMYAEGAGNARALHKRLSLDPLLGNQGIVIRPYVPLVHYATRANGMHISNEWRTFWMKKGGEIHLIAAGHYWSKYQEYMPARFAKSFSDEGVDFAQQAAELMAQHASFFVIDVAEMVEVDPITNSKWMVVEVNDAQMSGLCEIDPHFFYSHLTRILELPC